VKILLKTHPTKLSKAALAKDLMILALILFYYSQATNLTPFHQLKEMLQASFQP